jgi:hypothetical protein
MSLDARMIRQAPRLAPGDIITLHGDLHVEGSMVFDSAFKARHIFTEQAATLLSAIAHGANRQHLDRLAKEQAISVSQVRELLGFLNYIGALRRTRHAPYTAVAVRTRSSRLNKRFAASLWGVIGGTCQAIRLVWIALAGMLGILLWQNIVSPSTVWVIIACVVTFVGSLIAHEMAHLIALRMLHQPAVLVQGRLYLSIVRRKLARNQELIIAYVGPLAGMCLAALVTILFTSAAMAPAAGCCLAICGLHFLSLTPLSGDGKNIREARAA